jgi:hypothetical protein
MLATGFVLWKEALFIFVPILDEYVLKGQCYLLPNLLTIQKPHSRISKDSVLLG